MWYKHLVGVYQNQHLHVHSYCMFCACIYRAGHDTVFCWLCTYDPWDCSGTGLALLSAFWKKRALTHSVLHPGSVWMLLITCDQVLTSRAYQVAKRSASRRNSLLVMKFLVTKCTRSHQELAGCKASSNHRESITVIDRIPRPGTPLGSVLTCQPTGPEFKPGLRQCFFKREQVCGQPELWGSNLRARWLSKISDGCMDGQAHL